MQSGEREGYVQALGLGLGRVKVRRIIMFISLFKLLNTCYILYIGLVFGLRLKYRFPSNPPIGHKVSYRDDEFFCLCQYDP